MSECKHECVILKRICIFILGVVIGLAAGYQYGVGEVKERGQQRMKQRKAPEPRNESFFERKKERKRDFSPQNSGDVKR